MNIVDFSTDVLGLEKERERKGRRRVAGGREGRRRREVLETELNSGLDFGPVR